MRSTAPLQITNDNARQFNVRLVTEGESYGLNGCLAHHGADPLVEFYDATYANRGSFGPLGQFITRYHLSTLQAGSLCGLNLHCGVSGWHITGRNLMDILVAFS